MAELDFITYGIRPNNRRLLRRIHEAVSELVSFGDLELRSSWLYYGSTLAASRALGIPASTYRRFVNPQRVLPLDVILMTDKLKLRGESIRNFGRQEGRRRKLNAFQKMSDTELGIITDGANMIMELSDFERAALFPAKRPLPISREEYIVKVESWRETRSKRPVTSARKLLEAYIRMWNFRSHVRLFFTCRGVKRPLDKALECKNEIEVSARTSKICSVAINILREYQTYSEQWSEAHKHIDIQRNIMSSTRRKKFLAELEKRDGLICASASCEAVEDLDIDHFKPISRGGFSVLENLQLLCKPCNSKKGNK